MRRTLATLALLVLVGLGCQSPAVGVSGTETMTSEAVAATASVWGEVPRQCA